jgi:hypothetical protein
MQNAIRVAIIHRNRLFREGLAFVLSQQRGIRSCPWSLRIHAMNLPGAANASAIRPSDSHESEAQGLARLCSHPYGHIWPPQPYAHALNLRLQPCRL